MNGFFRWIWYALFGNPGTPEARLRKARVNVEAAFAELESVRMDQEVARIRKEIEAARQAPTP